MQRITDQHLNALCGRLNRITNSPSTPYEVIDGRHVAQIGNYHISHAYGGVALHRMFSDGGGVSSPLSTGHIPKRELYNLIHAFIQGIDHVNN